MTIHGIECKVISRQGKSAEVEIEGQKITVPAEFIPESVKAGRELKLYFLDSDEAAGQEKKLAKSILEQILNGN
ncbi:MAG: hypothetical protein ABSE91_03405 [Patescibacteria group bacterium]|jgi:hypothetical protein